MVMRAALSLPSEGARPARSAPLNRSLDEGEALDTVIATLSNCLRLLLDLSADRDVLFNHKKEKSP